MEMLLPNTGQYIIMAVAGVILVVGIIALVIYLVGRKKKKDK